MNITISDPTPAPEMPVMWAVAVPPKPNDIDRRWEQYGFSTEENANSFILMRCPFGSRLIRIDPNAPSFEPGPMEWVTTDGIKITSGKSNGLLCIDQGQSRVAMPFTRTDIGHLISALMTAWHAAKEGT